MYVGREKKNDGLKRFLFEKLVLVIQLDFGRMCEPTTIVLNLCILDYILYH